MQQYSFEEEPKATGCLTFPDDLRSIPSLLDIRQAEDKEVHCGLS